MARSGSRCSAALRHARHADVMLLARGISAGPSRSNWLDTHRSSPRDLLPERLDARRHRDGCPPHRTGLLGVLRPDVKRAVVEAYDLRTVVARLRDEEPMVLCRSASQTVLAA